MVTSKNYKLPIDPQALFPSSGATGSCEPTELWFLIPLPVSLRDWPWSTSIPHQWGRRVVQRFLILGVIQVSPLHGQQDPPWSAHLYLSSFILPHLAFSDLAVGSPDPSDYFRSVLFAVSFLHCVILSFVHPSYSFSPVISSLSFFLVPSFPSKQRKPLLTWDLCCICWSGAYAFTYRCIFSGSPRTGMMEPLQQLRMCWA